jgi:hypothetical protein
MLRHRILAAVATSVVLAALAVGAAAMSPRLIKKGALYRVERGNVAYSFDAAWRVETFWVRNANGRWEKAKEASDPRMASVKALLLTMVGKPSVKEIPVEAAREVEQLKALGYL